MAFKDILDAQSEIKPADFRERVQAAGARDYGEDVAERNMGENGVDLASMHVRAFYAQSDGGQRPRRMGSLGETGPRAGRAGVRRRSLLSMQYTLPSESSAPSSPEFTRARDPARRRSVNTYVPLRSGNRGISLRSPEAAIEEMDFGFPHPLDTAPAPVVRTARRPRILSCRPRSGPSYR